MKAALFALTLLLAPALARAQELTAPSTPHVADPNAEPPPPPPQASLPPQNCYAAPVGRTHDGFYLRLQIGGSYVTARQGLNEYSGKGLAYGLAIGATLVPNFVAFGTVIYNAVSDPTGSPYGYSMTVKGDLTTQSFGAGLAYYFEPGNVYVAAAVLEKSAEVEDATKRNIASSNRGAGFDVMLGREWWVGPAWGLGVAGEVTGAWMTDTLDHATTWSSFSYSLLFSATYN